MKMSIQNKFDLDTPCLVLDLDILENNIQSMQSAAEQAGKHLRPHAKTHKCSTLAHKQMQAGAIGISVAKVSEAEALIKTGLSGILITGPVATPTKIKKLISLLEVDSCLMTVVDHRDSILLLATALREKNMFMDVLLDIDVGLRRTGVSFSSSFELVDLILSQPNLSLRGIQAYAGHVQHIRSYENRRAASHLCLQESGILFRELKTAIKTCDIYSASGTGTFDIDLANSLITELQVGSYVCMDAEYLAIGSAGDPTQFSSFGPALKLLTTVISNNHKGFFTVDAGLKSIYKDGGKPIIIGLGNYGMQYDWFGDEYGKVTYPDNLEIPSIGSVLELVPPHCDPTINLYDIFFLTRGNKAVGVWPIDLRGCSQ